MYETHLLYSMHLLFLADVCVFPVFVAMKVYVNKDVDCVIDAKLTKHLALVIVIDSNRKEQQTRN